MLSYFKSVKRSNPEQHAAKKRKVILQSHEIESLLKTEEEEGQCSDESGAEEDDQSLTLTQCVTALQQDGGADEFENDSDWEDVANTTLDDVEKEMSLDDVSQSMEVVLV